MSALMHASRSSARALLCCEVCGASGGVRRKRCPYVVRGSSERSPEGQRHTLPYCSASALCSSCTVSHRACRELAAEKQLGEDARQVRLDHGEHVVVCRRGDWADGVATGYVECTFGGRVWGGDVVVVDLPNMAAALYDWLEDIPAHLRRMPS